MAPLNNPQPDTSTLISVVTGTLNRRELLPSLIENIVVACPKLELILVDGGSSDGSVEYIKQLDHKRTNLIEVKHRSPYPHYMNLGIKAAKHEWIAQWNDDVVLLDSWDKVLQELKENYDLYVFRWTKRLKEEMFVDKENERWIQYHDCMNFGVYHRRVFKTLGLYDSKFHYYHCDQDMSVRAISFGMKRKVSSVRVCEIYTKKRAEAGKSDDKILRRNFRRYRKKKLPKTVEWLEA